MYVERNEHKMFTKSWREAVTCIDVFIHRHLASCEHYLVIITLSVDDFSCVVRRLTFVAYYTCYIKITSRRGRREENGIFIRAKGCLAFNVTKRFTTRRSESNPGVFGISKFYYFATCDLMSMRCK